MKVSVILATLFNFIAAIFLLNYVDSKIIIYCASQMVFFLLVIFNLTLVKKEDK